MAAVSSLNGVAPSWADVETTVNVSGGQTKADIDWKALNWESSVKRGVQKRGGKVVAKTTGELENTASGTLYKPGLRALMRILAEVAPRDAAGRPQISKARFDIVIKHSGEDDANIYVSKLLGCSLDKNAQKSAEGPDADEAEVDLNPMEIVDEIDGQDVVLL